MKGSLSAVSSFFAGMFFVGKKYLLIKKTTAIPKAINFSRGLQLTIPGDYYFNGL